MVHDDDESSVEESSDDETATTILGTLKKVNSWQYYLHQEVILSYMLDHWPQDRVVLQYQSCWLVSCS